MFLLQIFRVLLRSIIYYGIFVPRCTFQEFPLFHAQRTNAQLSGECVHHHVHGQPFGIFLSPILHAPQDGPDDDERRLRHGDFSSSLRHTCIET